MLPRSSIITLVFASASALAASEHMTAKVGHGTAHIEDYSLLEEDVQHVSPPDVTLWMPFVAATSTDEIVCSSLSRVATRWHLPRRHKATLEPRDVRDVLHSLLQASDWRSTNSSTRLCRPHWKNQFV